MRSIIQGVMKAIRVHQHGGPEVLKLEDHVPIPQPGPNQVATNEI